MTGILGKMLLHTLMLQGWVLKSLISPKFAVTILCPPGSMFKLLPEFVLQLLLLPIAVISISFISHILLSPLYLPQGHGCCWFDRNRGPAREVMA